MGGRRETRELLPLWCQTVLRLLVLDHEVPTHIAAAAHGAGLRRRRGIAAGISKTAPFDEGWTSHFLKAPGCPNNPRAFDGGNPDDDFHD